MRFGMIRYGPAASPPPTTTTTASTISSSPTASSRGCSATRRDGTFEDVTAPAGLAGLDGVSVGVFADYDNDGYKDLFVSRTFKPNQLFHNDGDGTFTDVTAALGDRRRLLHDGCVLGRLRQRRLPRSLRRAAISIRARTSRPPSTPATASPTSSTGTTATARFTNVTEQAGVGETGLCLGTVWGDYDDDGDPDLYVVNDFGRKTLYHNDGQRHVHRRHGRDRHARLRRRHERVVRRLRQRRPARPLRHAHPLGARAGSPSRRRCGATW